MFQLIRRLDSEQVCDNVAFVLLHLNECVSVLEGRFTTKAEVDFAVDLCEKHVSRLREMSPLWEMVQDGIDLSTIQWSQPDHHH